MLGDDVGEGLRQEYSLAVAGIRGPCPTQADDVPDELVSQWTRDAQKDHTRSDIPDRFNKGQCRRVVQNLGSERLHSVECFVHFNVSNHCRAQLYRQLIVGKRILLDQLDIGLHTRMADNARAQNGSIDEHDTSTTGQGVPQEIPERHALMVGVNMHGMCYGTKTRWEGEERISR